jgi:hypothetical protein
VADSNVTTIAGSSAPLATPVPQPQVVYFEADEGNIAAVVAPPPHPGGVTQLDMQRQFRAAVGLEDSVTTQTVASINHFEVAQHFARELHRTWAGAEVYLRPASDEPDVIEVAVVADEWDYTLLKRSHELAAEEMKASGVVVLVNVEFSSAHRPDTAGCTLVV